MEQIYEKEQPQNQLSQGSDVNNSEIMGENNSGFEGSLLGKFKDVNSLMEAYANLQAEFTRKSQKLSELTRRDNLNSANSIQNIAKSADKFAQNSVVLSESAGTMQSLDGKNINNLPIKPLQHASESAGTMQTLTNEQPDNAEIKPRYLSETWSGEVAKFLAANHNAKKFASEIAKELLSDKVLADSPHSLELAYAKVLEKNFKSENELVNDEQFINNYILTSEKVKQKIINNYLQTLKQSKTPTVISSKSGGFVGLTPQDKPKSLDEAKKIMELMLKQK